MFDLTNDELDCLRICRRNADDLYRFSLACVPKLYLNTVLRALRERGYVERNSGIMYKITPKGREALHQAALAAEQEQQRLQQLAQQVADDRAYAESQQSAHDAKSSSNQRKQFSHDFKVAAFSIAGALLVEHFGVVIDFISKVIEKISALLH